jgi:ABC-type antimicrobial peptide transport system permease subunit
LVAGVLIRKLLMQWMSDTGAGYHGLLVATLLLAACSLVACLLPAQRAASISPVEALRHE